MTQQRAAIVCLAVVLLCILFLPRISSITAQQLDSDGDGVPDSNDQCPNAAGPRNNNGCPILLIPVITLPPPVTTRDSDGDGVPDNEDECPSQPHNGAIFNGCPDSDGDGLVDNIDLCPGQAGPPDPPAQGCPVEQQPVPQPPQPQPQVTPLPFFPEDDGGQCLVATLSASPVNVRADASLSAEIIGVITASFLYPAISVKNDGDGQPWYELEQGGYVASWVVRTSDSCATLGDIDGLSGGGSPLVVFDPAVIAGAFAPCPDIITQADAIPHPILNWALSETNPCAAVIDSLQDAVFGLPPVADEIDPQIFGAMVDTCPDVLFDTVFKLALLQAYDPTAYDMARASVNGGGCDSAAQVGGIDAFQQDTSPLGYCGFGSQGSEPPAVDGDLCVVAAVVFENHGNAADTAGLFVRINNRVWVKHSWWKACILGQGPGHWDESILAESAFPDTVNVPGNSTAALESSVFLPLAGEHHPVFQVIPLNGGTDITVIGGTAGFVDPLTCDDDRVAELPPGLLGTLLAPTAVTPGLAANPTEPTPTPFDSVIANPTVPTPTPFGLVAVPTSTPLGLAALPTATYTPSPFGLVGNPTASFTPSPFGLVGNPTASFTPSPFGLVGNPTATDTPTPLGFVANPTATDTPDMGLGENPTDTPTPPEGGLPGLTPGTPLPPIVPPGVPGIPEDTFFKPVAGFDARLAVFEDHVDARVANTDLYLLSGDDVQPFMADPVVLETNPALDSTGATVAYVQTDAQGMSSLHLADLTTRQSRLLMASSETQIVLPFDPVWMPGDTALLVTLLDSATGQPSVYSLDVDPNVSALPSPVVANAAGPTVAANGRYIVYLRDGQVFTMGLASGREQAITDPEQLGGCQMPAFDMNPLRVYFVCTAEGITSLYRYDQAGLVSIADVPVSAFNPEPGPVDKVLLADDNIDIWFGTSDGQFARLIHFDDGRQARNISIPALRDLQALF